MFFINYKNHKILINKNQDIFISFFYMNNYTNYITNINLTEYNIFDNIDLLYNLIVDCFTNNTVNSNISINVEKTFLIVTLGVYNIIGTNIVLKLIENDIITV